MATPLVQVDVNAHVDVLIPTAINLVLLAAENITASLRKGQASSIELPSIYKRAFLVVYETDEIAVVRQSVVK